MPSQAACLTLALPCPAAHLSCRALQIELWDDNILRDTFLCSARIPLRALLSVPGRGIGVMERQITFMPGEVHTLTGTKRGEPINATCIARLTRMDKGDAEIPPEAAGVSLREIPAGASALPGGSAAAGLGAGMAVGGMAAGGMAAGSMNNDVKITQPATAAIAAPNTFVEQVCLPPCSLGSCMHRTAACPDPRTHSFLPCLQGVVYERGVQNVSIPSTQTVSEQVPRTIMTEEVVQVPKVIMVEEVVQVPKTVMETVYKEVPTTIPAVQEVIRPVGVERVTEVKERIVGAIGPAEAIGQPVPIASAGSNMAQAMGGNSTSTASSMGNAAQLASGADRASNL